MSDEIGYSVESRPGGVDPQPGDSWRMVRRLLAGVVVLTGLYLVLQHWLHFDLWQFLKDLYMLKYFSQLGKDASYGLLFALGVLTSFHCIGMCGGITLSQTIRYKQDDIRKSYAWLLPTALYNGGRVIAYTLVGAVVGGLGQVISFSGVWKGIIPLLGGLFMIIMGIHLLDIFPFLRRLTIPVPKFAARKVLTNQDHGPFYIGLLTGLMPCGPLQIVQLYALSTRSVVFGALSMFVFSLGTVPLLFSLGAVNSLVNKNKIKAILKASAALVVVLGLVMVGRGLSLSGVMIHLPSWHSQSSPVEGETAVARIEGPVQTVTQFLKPNRFVPLVVQKGIPVRWIIQVDAENLNECNKAIHIPKFAIDREFSPGENLVEFTPWESGEFVYTCWMGMIKSKIMVVDELPVMDQTAAKGPVGSPDPEQVPSSSVMSGEGSASSPEIDESQSSPDTSSTAESNPGKEPAADEPAAPAKPPATTISKTILISGMVCVSCVHKIQEALAGLDGVQSLEVSVGRATVVLERDVSDETLKASVEQAGLYKVTSISHEVP